MKKQEDGDRITGGCIRFLLCVRRPCGAGIYQSKPDKPPRKRRLLTSLTKIVDNLRIVEILVRFQNDSI